MEHPKFLLEKKVYGELLVRTNGLYERGFEEWLFYPGMLFDSLEKWWGDGGQRLTRHEGIDICLYRDEQGQPFRLDKMTDIPVMHDGIIARIDDDFLGKSVYVAHDIRDGNGHQLYSIYGHTRPADSIHEGSPLNKGDIIGTISDLNTRKVRIFEHLHVTMAWMPEPCAYETLNWPALSERKEMTLLNPMTFMNCDYSIIPFENEKWEVGSEE